MALGTFVLSPTQFAPHGNWMAAASGEGGGQPAGGASQREEWGQRGLRTLHVPAFVYVSANCSCCLGFLTIIKIQTATGEGVSETQVGVERGEKMNVDVVRQPQQQQLLLAVDACLSWAGSHTNCFQFNENFNRKALWLPKIVHAPLAGYLSPSSFFSPSFLSNLCPKAVVVSNVNVACIKCIKDADVTYARERERDEDRHRAARRRWRKGHGVEEK